MIDEFETEQQRGTRRLMLTMSTLCGVGFAVALAVVVYLAATMPHNTAPPAAATTNAPPIQSTGQGNL